LEKPEIMYIVIRSNPDGDSYHMSSSLDNARVAFSNECKLVNESIIDSEERVALLRVDEDVNFGSGAWGDWYGCEVVEEFYAESEIDEE
jgi:hypothetical protein